MREEPLAGETVALVVTAEDDETNLSALEDEIESIGGVVTDRLEFDAIRVELAQERIDDLCALSGIASIETEHAIGHGGDAGEDT